MITGINRVFPHDGRDYHIQAEDLGEEAAIFEVRLYHGGGVVWQKRVPYGDLLAQELPRRELEQALRVQMEKMIRTVEAAIVKGKIG